MVTFADIDIEQPVDGVPYCVDKALTTSEVDLAEPVATLFNQALVATVLFTAGPGAVSPSYVVLQSSLDGGQTWWDAAWCQSSITTGTDVFVMAAGQPWALVTRQTRATGTAPGGSSAILGMLGGLIRFVGKTGTGAGGTSSSSSGPPPMAVSINFKQLGLR